MLKSKIVKLFTWVKEHKIQILVALGALVILCARRPDAFLNPQFWAEDAKWFMDAFNGHYSPLLLVEPYAGYLIVVQRLVGMCAGLVPVELGSHFFNACALGIQVLPLIYIWSKRTDYISVRIKIFLTLAYVFLPYTEEIHANLTNSQWFLSISVFLLIFIKEAKHIALRTCDRFIILVGSLSGPFSIFLAPIVALEAWRLRKISIRHYLVILGGFTQILFLIATREPYAEVHIGYSVTTFLQILGGQVFGSGLFGYEAIHFFASKPWIAPIASVLGIQLIAYAFWKSNRFLRYFIFFGAVVLAASLVSTLGTPPGTTWWYYFTTEAFGGRYLFIPHLAVFVTLGWLAFTKTKIHILPRVAAASLLAGAFLVGVPHDFRHTPFEDLKYQHYIQKYHDASPGTAVEVPVNPGGVWKAILIKE